MCVISKKACLYTSGFVVSFFKYFVKDRQIWASDWLQGEVSGTVVSLTTSKSIFESSNSGRIRRPRGVVRLDFERVLSLVVKKHSCKLDYQDKFLVLKRSSLTVSCVCFPKTSLVLSHRGLLQEKYEKRQEQFVSFGDGWGPVSLECCLKLPHIRYNHSPV